MNYMKSVLYNAPPEKVYEALTTKEGLRGWWTQECLVDGGHLDFRFGKSHVVMDVEEATPGRKVVWRCVAHHYDGVDPADEWIDTRVVFCLEPDSSGGTRIHFSHEGLVPALACWEACNRGWDRNLLESLKHYVETGRGEPYPQWRADLTP
jgi:uncharacterized protein YndB with AHSA1/START domain